MVPEGDEIGLETAFQRTAMGADDHFFRRRERVQGNGDFSDESQGSLASCEELAKVGVRQGLVDGIAAAAAPETLVRVVCFNQPADILIVAPSLKLREDGIQPRTGHPVIGLLHAHRVEIGSIG